MPTEVRKQLARGFALPTILIASIVMLIVLLASVSSTAAVRNAILNQYYTQLAQVAGEAGVEYAKACLNQNGGVPLWNDANPLRPSTNCSGVPAVACPTTAADSRCAVAINDNVRSSFSVGLPGLDADGKAKTIPNNGYVEILRTSNNAVWRTYSQPSVQAAVVPDLCAGTATSALGWVNASKFSSADSFPTASASTIGISTSNVNPGSIYFRKDFSVTEPGTYTLQVKADDISDVYIDGTYVTSTVSSSTTYSATKNLSVGCHTVMAKVTNNGIAQSLAKLTLSLKRDSDSSPVVVTDSSWRVSAGSTKHYSQVGYYADPAAWTAARDYEDANMGTNSSWNSISGVPARAISTTHSYTGSNSYPIGYTYFRDSNTITVASPTEVLVTYICDDACNIYLDGQIIASGTWAAGITTTTLTLTEGSHKFGMSEYNSSVGQARLVLAVKRISDGAALTFTNPGWMAANFWETSQTNSYSYDNSYKPNPDPLPESSVAVLAVGGGGGGGMDMGGGGGGGGVVYNPAYSVTGSVSVVIGGGGSGAPAGGTNGQPTAHQFTIPATNGGDTIFGTIDALGGGFGGSSVTTYTPGITGGSGGSGGGSGGYNNLNAGSYSGGAGIIGQGNRGGNSGLAHYSGGGGGAGGAGASGPSQPNGGVGIQYPTMSPYYWGGGGGGASYSLATGGNGGIGGGGGGAVGVTTGGAGLNPGSAGGGGVPNAQTNMPGGNAGANTGGGGGGGSHYNSNNKGGNGGSGIVIISYATGSMTATGGTITTAGGNTIHRFTSSDTFTVTSIQ